MKKIKRYGLSGCAGGLALLLLVILACPGFSSVSAQDAPDSATGTATTTEIYVKSSLSITTQEKLDFEVTPNSDQATFNSKMTTVSVTTNNQTGYGLYLHTTSVDGKLRSRDSSVTQTINPLTQDAAPASSAFASNSWGYSTNNATYKAISTTSQKIISTTAAATEKTHDIYIGAKIGVDLPVGFYTGDVVFSAVANPVTVHGLQDLTYMQDMTPKVCEITPKYVSTTNYTRKQLTDRRDGKQYWVAKLADGNCWMQQNLALNLGFEMTSGDTDLALDRKITLPATIPSTGGVSTNQNSLESRSVNSQWYYQWNTATAGSGTTSAITTDGQIAPDSICPKGWQLPLASLSYNTITQSGNPENKLGSGSFYDLLISHKITSFSTMINIGLAAPLNFAAFNYFYEGGLAGSTNYAVGNYWSRVAKSGAQAYHLGWNASNSTFNPSTDANYGRYSAATVRCVARQVAR